MEKVLYLMRAGDGGVSALKSALLGPAAQAIVDLTGVHKLRVAISDEDVADAAPLRQENNPPVADALVSVWLDSAVGQAPIASVLEDIGQDLMSYVVAESEPIVSPVREGARTPGVLQLAMFRQNPDLSFTEFMDVWMNSHTQIAIDTQSTFGYRQNVISRALSEGATDFSAIVEEQFPLAAMTSQEAFYDAVGDDALYQTRFKEMIDSVFRFIDMSTINVVAMSEYTIKD